MNNRLGRFVRQWAIVLLAGIGFTGGTSATLLDQGPNMVYDDVLNIIWTREAGGGGGDALQRTWVDANTWAANLVFGGFDDWRLPWASVVVGVGPTEAVHVCTGAGGADELACRDNEMGYMFYYNLDGNILDDKTGNQTAVGGQMLTGIEESYWTGTLFNADGVAWHFNFNSGGLGAASAGAVRFAWAVRDVDTTAVAEPDALLLLALGLLGLGWSRSKKRNLV